jgi:hypothetical protein
VRVALDRIDHRPSAPLHTRHHPDQRHVMQVARTWALQLADANGQDVAAAGEAIDRTLPIHIITPVA